MVRYEPDECCAEVVGLIDHIRQPFEIATRLVHFELDRLRGAFAQHKVGLDIGMDPQRGECCPGKPRGAGSADSDD